MTQTERRNAYSGYKLLDTPVSHVDFEQHTMGKSNLIAYIGREGARDYEINTKKFSTPQASQLVEAYRNAMSVRVISAYRDDFEEILTSNNRKAKPASTLDHRRHEKQFNIFRQTTCIAESNDGAIPPELWVFVFPTKQYVDQVAELISAIFTHFRMCALTGGTKVFTSHFPDLENSISRWSDFDKFAATFVRHGDIVAIGNVDFFNQGLTSIGFEDKDSDWLAGGVNEMFRVMRLVSRYNGARITLLGIQECFWGDASAQYVETLRVCPEFIAAKSAALQCAVPSAGSWRG
jgi:hypothetical protein